jgi:hypothetical protein
MGQKLKTIQSSVLRGGYCAIWIFGGMMAFYFGLFACEADAGSPEQTQCAARFLWTIGVVLVAALAHAYLISGATKNG